MQNINILYMQSKLLRLIEEDELAKNKLLKILEINPDYYKAHNLLSKIELNGPHYFVFLNEMHEAIKPQTYLEIGVDEGNSLKLSHKSSLSIGVDPVLKITDPLSENFKFYKMKSDYFFDNYAQDMFEERKVDMAFIDGMHEAHQALRDFINVEKYCHSKSKILMHDVVPLNRETSTSIRNTLFWSGDVWKTFITIDTFFKDLKIYTVNCPPTGVSVISNCNPQRQVSEAMFVEMYDFMDRLNYHDIEDSKEKAFKIHDYKDFSFL